VTSVVPHPGDHAAGVGAAAGTGSSSTGLAERGLAQALAAALWEAESDGGAPPPVDVPGGVGPADPTYAAPSASAAAVASSPRASAAGAAPGAPAAGSPERLDELVRLQGRLQDHVDKLHAENRRLREGELVATTAPLLLGLAKLADQMETLAAGEAAGGSAVLLRGQLLQVLELSAGVTAFAPQEGELFDVTRQRGVRGIDTVEPGQAGRVASTLRPGFLRADGSVVRVAEVEVYRATSGAPRRAGTGAGTAGHGSADNRSGA